jgi:hypothetical protein
MGLHVRSYKCYKDVHQFQFRDFYGTSLAFTLFGNKFIVAVIYESLALNITKNTNG